MINQNYILITGMVRSGTTLLSRAIDSHSKIATPPDPYFAFFRAFRNEIYNDYIDDFDDDKALSDNFFKENLDPRREIKESTLDRRITNQNLEEIKRNIIKFAKPSTNSPLVVPHIKKIRAETYRKLYIELMNIIKEAYGDENSEWIGFKQTWVEEFVSPLINTFSNMKVVQIIRDPRAVIASREKTTQLSHNYPLYFMLKHWRKSFAYALYNSHHYSDRFKLIRYEDLIEKPEDTMSEITEFIGLEYEPNTINPDSYRDGKDNSWTDNSAYKSTNKITSKYKDKWKDILTEKEVQYIEDLCRIEMDKLNYITTTESNINKSLFYNVDFNDELDTSWIKKQASGEESQIELVKNELLRYYVYNDYNNKWFNKDFLEIAFIIPNFLSLTNEKL